MESLSYCLDQLTDWALLNGLVMRPAAAKTSGMRQTNSSIAIVAPVTLHPTVCKSELFHRAIRIAEIYNELYATIAMDEQWLGDLVQELSGIDDFVRNLWNIHSTIKSEGGYAHEACLGIWRSDYLDHSETADENSGASLSLKQVEFNTISSSFGCLAEKVNGLHRFLASTFAYPDDLRTSVLKEPVSRNIEQIARGLAVSYSTYRPLLTNLPLIALFIVQEGERNSFDQRFLEDHLISLHGIPVFRLPLSGVLTQTHLDSSKTLTFSPSHNPTLNFEVSTVYYRAGYDPSEYPDQSIWTARLHLERSRAIKCPSVLGQIAGMKKVQQELATPGSTHLERYLPSRTPDELAELRSTFMDMYPMDGSSAAGAQGRALATDPDRAKSFVLKPQREGGGHNIYREKIPGFLEGVPQEHWHQYVLMRLIEPPAARNTIIRDGEAVEGAVVNELGVFGVCLYDPKTKRVVENYCAGTLMRTKGVEADEGGVAAGFACIGNPLPL